MTSSLAATTVIAFGPSWLQPEELIYLLGPYVLLGLCLIIFAECGLLFGFFLPGDSLLFTAGLFVANGFIGYPIWLVCLLLTVCAILGNIVGYYIGYTVGPPLFKRPDSRMFKQEYVDRTHAFFVRYGGRAIILGRFVPIVRTFITAIAGVASMDARKYFGYTVIGGLLWATGVTLLGYWLGRIPFVEENLGAFLIGIVLLSISPIIAEMVRARWENRRARTAGVSS